ncbi:hypothetical protein ACIA6T_18020 [Streptomyces sp. NPDC051740]
MTVSTGPVTGTEPARHPSRSPQEADGILDAAASAQAARHRRDITVGPAA